MSDYWPPYRLIWFEDDVLLKLQYSNVLSRPDLAAKIRDEVLSLVTYSVEGGTRKAILELRLVEK